MEAQSECLGIIVTSTEGEDSEVMSTTKLLFTGISEKQHGKQVSIEFSEDR